MFSLRAKYLKAPLRELLTRCFQMSMSEFNYVEAAVWISISAVLLVASYRQGRRSPYFTTSVVACIAFAAFGVSDIIEVQTGAWWRPFGLLVLKASCVILLIGCYYHYTKLKRANI